MSSDHPIEPETKVAALLDHYPELEDVLIGMAPPFEKLRNPLLRRSVAKVASLRQAAAVGRIPVAELVDRLRAAVGQPPLGNSEGQGAAQNEAHAYFTDQPEWFDEAKVVATLVESELDPDVMPLTPLFQRARQMRVGEIVALVTGDLPAPGIDIMKKQGFQSWSVAAGEQVRTYFHRPAAPG